MFTAALLSTVFCAAWAHDLYLMPDIFHTHKGARLRVALHNGDAFPESEAAPTPARMQEARLSGAEGSAAVQDLRVEGNETVGLVDVPGSGDLILSVHTIPNFIELAPEKFTSYLKEEGLADVVEWRAKHGEAGKPGRERYVKFAKSIVQSDHSDDFYQHRIDFPIEIIPLADPYGVRVGGSLPVRVLFRGKPAVGLQVEAARVVHGMTVIAPAGRTDKDGRLNVRIDSRGKWRLHSLRMVRAEGTKDVDWESFWASLTFEVS